MTKFWQLAFEGFSLGCVYALIALGFTVIYRSSAVINFAQGSMLLIAAYLISWLTVNEGVPFFVSMLISIAMLAAAAVGFQAAVLRRVRRMLEQPIFTVVMITIGLSITLTAAVDAIWGPQQRLLGDPWGSSAVHAAGVVFNWDKLWAIIFVAVIVAGFYAFDRYSRYGLATRATAADEEAALAVGIPVMRIHALAWGVAGSLAVVAGLFLAGFPNSPNPALGNSALLAFPAIILGGLESPLGAVVGGIVIGLVQLLTQGYEPGWLGNNFYEVAPYVVMIIVLLIRPYGLFGARPVERL
ncbi:MAG TPA: branched-chain amino acid ABC transporter permease [Solirubrobacteraceae bacterium]|jgi:branched-chain amino acid transport system permease protein|nr:branched-chain amino acid ABC transporter permease [Solirubrobacteraceae bacterium]